MKSPVHQYVAYLILTLEHYPSKNILFYYPGVHVYPNKKSENKLLTFIIY